MSMNYWREHELIKKWQACGVKTAIPENREYDRSKKNILMISHTLERGGAPLVLLELMRQYQNQYNVFLLTMEDGSLREEMLENNIPIFFAMPSELKEYVGGDIALEFEMVWINTIICHQYLLFFQNKKVPTFWWFHEPEKLFALYYERMPELKLYSNNIRILAVSRLVQRCIRKYYRIEAELFHMPIKDCYNPLAKMAKVNDRVAFFMPAKFQRLKGHDIIAKAILNMSGEMREKACFIFAGAKDKNEPDYYELIKQLSLAFPDTVKLLGELSKEEVYEIYQEVDCVLAPSRIDATPTTIIEAMMFKKICICTDTTGISLYLENGINGIVVPSEDENELLKALMYVIENKSLLREMCQMGRIIYEKNFETSVVWNRLKELEKRYTENGD